MLWLCRFNAAVFDGRLPADLEIAWSAHLKTTAGTTHFRREPAAFPGAKPRQGAKLPVSSQNQPRLLCILEIPCLSRIPTRCCEACACASTGCYAASGLRDVERIGCSGCRYSASVAAGHKGDRHRGEAAGHSAA